jgi:acyl-CoA thioester hydrolase
MPSANIKPTLLHTLMIPVRWGDMDALGHVNSAAYFVYMEQARVSWLASVGARDIGIGANAGAVIANAYCTFHRSITYPAELEVRMLGGAPGRSSFESYYELRDTGENTVLYATGGARIVWVDYASGRPLPLPEFIRRRLPARSG